MRLVWLLILMLVLPLISAATLTGSIYNYGLELEKDVLVQINTTPPQKYLAKDGHYTLQVPAGSYTLIANKGFKEIQEQVTIKDNGKFVYDIFLINSISEEEELWAQSGQEFFTTQIVDSQENWRYWAVGLIILILIIRFFIIRKKYGPLRKFKKKVREEHNKSIKEHQQDLIDEPNYLEDTIKIIQKHQGRISQKQLRREMLHLSEAKVSLILTELEHKGLIEKVKKGRGNVILLKGLS